MLIKALCDYADKRETNPKEKAIPEGWCKHPIHFKINLSLDGKIVSIDDIREPEIIKMKNKKEKVVFKPTEVILPKRKSRSGVFSETIEQRGKYIFGLEYEKNAFVLSEKFHRAFIKHELNFFQGLDSEICCAYKNFITTWNPAAETENPELLKIAKNYQTASFRFALTGCKGFLDEDEQFIEKYNNLLAEKKNALVSQDTPLVPCGILGEKLPVARIHDKIKFSGGNATGCVLVGMKESAFESYGKTQSYNSNISEQAMKKYTSILNQLLADPGHRVIIDNMVILFFAMKADDANECDMLWSFLSDSFSNPTDIEQFMQSMFHKAKRGTIGDTNIQIDENVLFYVAGLTSNASRICQKFIYRDKFGKIIDNLVQHQRDLQIEEEQNKQIKFSWINKELISPKSIKDKVPPPLMTSILISALNGTDYPNALLETVVRRVKTDSDTENKPFIKLNRTRAGIIKACLNRKQRRAGKKEEITMSLNPENKDPAYLCGRLFAVYEKIQQDSSGGDLNRTIKDSYFASACARPSAIMTKLSQLAQNHLRKLEDKIKIYYNKLIAEIMDGLEGAFPQTLNLDSQGKFIVGYYQQNKMLYTSHKSESDKSEN
ncbi:MAG: type I-C CRISPR-associated protein Cas8c/Csd1 [Oscillospiraceae bacterium]|nr:type I-C CRISPR-associated protein Cas8c/Csd1 [Oscillospiraceae bacterium]